MIFILIVSFVFISCSTEEGVVGQRGADDPMTQLHDRVAARAAELLDADDRLELVERVLRSRITLMDPAPLELLERQHVRLRPWRTDRCHIRAMPARGPKIAAGALRARVCAPMVRV